MDKKETEKIKKIIKKILLEIYVNSSDIYLPDDIKSNLFNNFRVTNKIIDRLINSEHTDTKKFKSYDYLNKMYKGIREKGFYNKYSEDYLDLFVSLKWIELDSNTLENIENNKNYTRLWSRILAVNPGIYEEIANYIGKLNTRALEYMAEEIKKINSDIYSKNLYFSKGVILYHSLRFYSKLVRPLLKPLVNSIFSSLVLTKQKQWKKNLSNNFSTSSQELVANTKDTKDTKEKDNKSSDSLLSPASRTTKLFSSSLDSLDKTLDSFWRNADILHSTKYKQKVKSIKNNIKYKHKKLNLKAGSKRFRFKNAIVINCSEVCRELEKINKKGEFIREANLDNLNYYKDQLEKGFAVEENIENFNNILSNILEETKIVVEKKGIVIKEVVSAFDVINKCLNKTVRACEAYNPTIYKYKFYSHVEPSLVKLATYTLKLHKAMYYVLKFGAKMYASVPVGNKIKSIVEKKIDRKHGKTGVVLIASVIHKTTSKYLNNIVEYVDKTIKDELEQVIESYSDDYKKGIKEIDKLRNRINDVDKIEIDLKTDGLTDKKKLKNKHHYFFDEVFSNLNDKLFKVEFDKYKKAQTKIIKDLVESLGLDDKIKEADKKNDLYRKAVFEMFRDRLEDISYTLKNMESFEDKSYLDSLNDLFEDVLKNKHIMSNISGKDAKTLLNNFNMFMQKSVVVSKYFKKRVNDEHHSALYLIYKYLLGHTSEKTNEKIKPSNDEIIEKDTKSLVAKIKEQINFIKDIPANSKKKLKEKIDNSNYIIRGIYKAIEATTTTIIKGFAKLGSILDPILKVTLPRIGAAVGMIGAAAIMDTLKSIIPAGTLLNLLDSSSSNIGYYFGDWVLGGLSYKLFSSINNPIQSYAGDTKYNTEVTNKIMSWRQRLFPHSRLKFKSDFVLESKTLENGDIQLGVAPDSSVEESKGVNEKERLKISEIVSLDVDKFCNDFRKVNLGIIKTINQEIINPLSKKYSDDKEFNNLCDDIKECIANLDSKEPVKFAKAVKDLSCNKNSIFLKLDKFLKSKIDEKSTSSKIANIEYMQKNLQSLNHSAEEIRHKLWVAQAEYSYGLQEFNNNINKLVFAMRKDPLLKKDFEDYFSEKKIYGIFSLSYSTRMKLKNIEMHLLKLVCTVNFVLVPVMKYCLPIALSTAGFFGLGAVGTAIDAATLGSDLGLGTILLSATGSLLGNVIARGINYGMKSWDKKSRQWLELAKYDLERSRIFQVSNVKDSLIKLKVDKENKIVGMEVNSPLNSNVSPPKGYEPYLRKKEIKRLALKDKSHKHKPKQ